MSVNEVNEKEEKIFDVNVFSDASPSSSPTPSTVAHNLWHGSVETSTDTLVESSSIVPIEQYTLTTTDNITSTTATNLSVTPTATATTTTTSNGHIIHHDDIVDDVNSNIDFSNAKSHKPNSDARNVILPEVHGVKSRNSWTGSNQISMDESILMQPEHQRMEILNNGRQENVPTMSTHRRRRNSSNSRQETSPNKLVNGR